MIAPGLRRAQVRSGGAEIVEMGRQIAVHLLEKDCEQLLHFVRDRDPVIILKRDTSSAELGEIARPCAEAGIYTLWNQPLAPDLVRRVIHLPKIGPRYTIV